MLQVEQVSKRFGKEPVLVDLSLRVDAGTLTVLLGPSGCGKTTLLRLIAGLDQPDSGQILWQGQNLAQMPAHQRGFGFVFQDYALFPHKNVAENVAFGLRMAGWAPERIQQRVTEALNWVGLPQFQPRTIHQLSGGEQQRVAVARALAPAPRLLLLDEPLGALDRTLRERLINELRQILRTAGQAMGYSQGITALYVTHDQAEAFALADQVALLQSGQIEQLGSPMELYRHPATPFVARFLGMENLIAGTVTSTQAVSTLLGDFPLPQHLPPLPLHSSVMVLVRPDAISAIVEGEMSGNDQLLLRGQLQDCSFRGQYQLITVQLPTGEQWRFELDAMQKMPAHPQPITLALSPERIHILTTAK